VIAPSSSQLQIEVIGNQKNIQNLHLNYSTTGALRVFKNQLSWQQPSVQAKQLVFTIACCA
jgi:hypothetical protein